ncbi:MAG: transglycosylase domain-containing protein [Anaerovoracaceae bacterium]
MGRKILKFIIGICLALGLFLGIYTLTVVANTPKITPDTIYDYLAESSTLYDDQGQKIENIYLDNGNRTNIKYDEMPKDLINAVVAIEDKTFWKHHGFNFLRMAGAIKDSIFSGGDISGTSTITQQLARNVYLAETKSVRSLSRKISEAYYTVVIENHLSKKEIIEAYLNTIYLGYNSYGIQSASQAYYNKDPKDLSLAECVSLASIPKAPDSYALIKRISNNTNDTTTTKSDKKVLLETPEFTYVYNGKLSENRRLTTIKFMKEQGYISDSEALTAQNTDLSKKVKVTLEGVSGGTTYFIDYLVDQLTDELMTQYNYSKAEAREKIYAGGLSIYTSLNSQAQKAAEDEFNKSYNFPSVANTRYDGNGNILNYGGNIMLYKYGNYFDINKNFTLTPNDYKLSNGNMILRAGKRLKFYETNVNDVKDYNIEFKDMYTTEGGVFSSIKGGILLVPEGYKSLDKKGNLIIDKSFFKDYPKFFKKNGRNYIADQTKYTLRAKVRQPQGAMVINDYRTGEIKAMIGGRDTSGKMLYNRAINPRQPGSSIKPLSVYSAALQQGKDAVSEGKPMDFTEYDKNQKTSLYGNYWTAASGINDAPLTIQGKIWPKNWYNGYRGVMSLRKSVEQSVNVNAVRVLQQVGNDYAIDQLKKFGVTSLVTKGATNDENAAALALGGMAQGISPLEMSAAFGTFPNKGVHVAPTSYKKIEDKKGKIILEPKQKKTQVVDEDVAFITQDILKTTVTNGLGKFAAVPGKPTAGKTGTTTDKKDIWFCGFTPQYSAALWIGNDIGLQLSSSSDAATRLWSKIMTAATANMTGDFPTQPSNVVYYGGEYFVNGTESSARYGEKEEKPKDEENTNEDGENTPNNPGILPDNPDPNVPPNPDGNDGDGNNPDGEPQPPQTP